MRRRVAAGVLVALGLSLTLAAQRTLVTIRTHERFRDSRTPAGGAAREGAGVDAWMPLQFVARLDDVPVPVLEAALSDAGFVVEPGAIDDLPRPGIPGRLDERLRRLWRRLTTTLLGRSAGDTPGPVAPDAPGSAGTAGPAERIVPPGRQTLQQIAVRSGREPAAAVTVVREAITRYHRSRGAPDAASGAPTTAPRPSPEVIAGRLRAGR